MMHEGQQPIEAMNEHIYATYQRLGGTMADDRFRDILKVFILLTVDAYTGGTVPELQKIEAELRNETVRRVAWDQWVAFMARIGHSPEDATRVLRAVDALVGYG
jgi:hypothetical protein